MVRMAPAHSVGKTHVIAPVRPENVLSPGVALKLGMTEQKHCIDAGFEHIIFYAARQT